MTLPYLTDNCIHYILQYLQNDRLTLFNCLLVNRYWCKSTVPLLYADPFKNITEKTCQIALTLIFCFNKAEILQLNNQLELNLINNIKFEEEYNPLFKYPKYLENYSYYIIDTVIYRWFLKCSGLSTINLGEETLPIFHQSILRQSRNIKRLDISTHIFYHESFKNFDFQNFISNLNSLSLKICVNTDVYNEIEQEFLSNIANIGINLRKLLIKFLEPHIIMWKHSNHIFGNSTNTTTLEKLYTIIQKQKNLQTFKIGSCNSLLTNFLIPLEFQNHSLVHIEFISINFNNVNLKSFNNLYNLKYLKFETCKDISFSQCEILNFALFKLKKLSFKDNYWKPDITSLMIKYFGESLQRLLIQNPKIYLIESILMYCSNLICLKIRIDVHFDLSLLPFLKYLSIKNLCININNYYSDNINEFFINLAINIPININQISIYFFTRSDKFLYFKDFLENCHNCFEIINFDHTFELKFLKIILNYIERSNNSLKILGNPDDTKLNDEEFDLLNQIKAKGVKIMDFFDIYEAIKDI
ncbi:hypothetical protein RclHR1_05420005 [Rhizophagus clarus]|uniref:F-box domain-containing protein n=1 Tax=Rhizophagus clarus TaxID=94130 RepID=A0A2Z6RNU2_9GLOM|nr:hypothetical protein RclHR1_05420005 [Rhizophagus clarus]GES75616.1 hypothetical protein GLOIN_2v1776264 [Rhizophagus clarus]